MEDLSLLQRTKYLFLLAVLSVAYFFWAIFTGLWGWLREKFE
jgi:hypothetical protein